MGKKIIVVPSHRIWRTRSRDSDGNGGGMYRAFISETAYEADSYCAQYVMCCNGLQMPRPEDYDRNGVAYVMPHRAEPIAVPPMGRSRHMGCCGMQVPDYADRSRMYPQFNGPCQQTMNPMGTYNLHGNTYNMAMGMPPMGMGHGPYGQRPPGAATTIQNGWRRRY